MSKYQRCDDSVNVMANELMAEFETHQPLIDYKVRVDFVFAYGDRDDEGRLISPALTKNGLPCLGLASKVSLKHRALGRGDCEIALDHDHWEQIGIAEQRAILDHELHHFEVKIDDRGIVLDDLGRPMIRLRKHDVEVGWFKIIAARHGKASQERIQAKHIIDSAGQFFWPEFCGELPLGPADDKFSVTMVTAKTTATASGATINKVITKLADHMQKTK